MTGQVVEWLSPAVTQHVAMALLHFLWQGAIVALFVGVILRLLCDDLAFDDEATSDPAMATSSSSRASARYIVASIGLLVMAVLPVVNLLVVQPGVDATGGLDAVAAIDRGAQCDPVQGNAIAMSLDIPAPREADLATTAAITQETRPVAEEGSESIAASPRVRFVLQGFFWIWIVGVAGDAGRDCPYSSRSRGCGHRWPTHSTHPSRHASTRRTDGDATICRKDVAGCRGGSPLRRRRGDGRGTDPFFGRRTIVEGRGRFRRSCRLTTSA